ncbi:hypothetical protein AM493_07135 [Flavobacterium akiainvivens]|uniref:Uncharacterized protein n=1 Tax=Flavobacterium akiainvivens TaxID=1202724 RepID=A0A0M8MA88_9FLAO|nr:hypothetical protein AM493_07135 [Flavobacterium akiainvivens]SFQ56970.1 hypothetical protein SAMN05444144_10891 [Flavobacterium akiainvivens]
MIFTFLSRYFFVSHSKIAISGFAEIKNRQFFGGKIYAQQKTILSAENPTANTQKVLNFSLSDFVFTV